MAGVIIKFLVVFVPTVLLAWAGWRGALSDTVWLNIIGWPAGILLSLAALLQLFILINGFARIHGAIQSLEEIEKADEEEFKRTGKISRIEKR